MIAAVIGFLRRWLNDRWRKARGWTVYGGAWEAGRRAPKVVDVMRPTRRL